MWSSLHFCIDERASSHTLTCRPSDLELFVPFVHALPTPVRNAYENTLSSPVHTLSDAQAVNWRQKSHGATMDAYVFERRSEEEIVKECIHSPSAL